MTKQDWLELFLKLCEEPRRSFRGTILFHVSNMSEEYDDALMQDIEFIKAHEALKKIGIFIEWWRYPTGPLGGPIKFVFQFAWRE